MDAATDLADGPLAPHLAMNDRVHASTIRARTDAIDAAARTAGTVPPPQRFAPIVTDTNAAAVPDIDA